MSLRHGLGTRLVLLADEGVLEQRQLISRSLKEKGAANLFGMRAEESAVHVARRCLAWRRHKHVLVAVIHGPRHWNVEAPLIGEGRAPADVDALDRASVRTAAEISKILVNARGDGAQPEIGR